MSDYARFERDKDERNRTACFILHNDTGSTGQGANDRSSIRMFEERMATEQNGDWLSGSRDSQKAVSRFIIDTAKDSNFFIDESQLSLLGERKRLPSGESVIYENAAQGVVYKIRDPFAKFHLKSGKSIDILYDHVVHNLLFPDTSYRLIGISSCLGEVRFIIAQNLFYTQNIPSQQQIDDYLFSMGLTPEDRYYYGNDYVSVTDVNATSDNVLINDDGKLLFIDPIIKLKKPINEIIAAFPFASLPEKKEQSLWSKIKQRIRFIIK